MELALFNQHGILFLVRWLHVFAGLIWIGMLYYFNFVQGSWFAETDASSKNSAISKLVPRALWWFRWGAMWTFLLGWTYLLWRGHLDGHAIFKTSWGVTILTGGLLGTFMWYNVWFVIWPNQKVVIENAQSVLAGKPANPDAASAGARAGVASRTNTLFSIPMLFGMVAARHLPLAVDPETYRFGLYFGLLALILLALEANALKGKTGPMTTVKGVLASGFGLCAVLYALMEIAR
ncbi:MAG: urate hydroxylase PuuD [Bdellovibrionales bacterium]|nr:urate hydroxylase PuuD [Bdellovibrionales bacterium]